LTDDGITGFGEKETQYLRLFTPSCFHACFFNVCHNIQDMMSPAASFESPTLHANASSLILPCPTTRWWKCDGDMCRQLCPNEVLILSIIHLGINAG